MAAGDLPEALVDVICGGIMNDPVVAEDEKTYDRDSLAKWMAYCRAGQGGGRDGKVAEAGQQRPVLSPWSREPMGDTVTPNRERNQALEVFKERQRRQKDQEESTAAKSHLLSPNDRDPSGAAAAAFPQAAAAELDPNRVSTIEELGRIFSSLDPLSEVLDKTLDGWLPPQLLVCGDEASGKSSLLERLTMLPVFPTSRKGFTRVPMKVRLRRSAVPVLPKLDLVNTRQNTTVSSRCVPIVTALQDIKEVMDDAVRREIQSLQNAVGASGISGGSGGGAALAALSTRFVCRDHAVVLHLYSPSSPVMDVVDLPGIHASTGGYGGSGGGGAGGGSGGGLSGGGLLNGGEDEVAFQTRALAATELRKARGHTMYMLVTPANLNHPSLSPLWDVVADEGERMDDAMRIGVFTKCDRADDTEDEELGLPFAELRDRILQKKSAGCESLVARGYIGTMIKPPKVVMAGPGAAGGGAPGSSISEQHQSNLGRIRQQAVNETAWFRQNGMGDSRDIARLAVSTSSSPHGSSVCGRVGCNDLVDHLEAMYLNYVKETWVPSALKKLREEEDRLDELIRSFGDPSLDAQAAAAAAGQHLTLHIPSLLNAFAASVLSDFQSRVTIALRTRVAKGTVDFGAAMLAELLPAGGSVAVVDAAKPAADAVLGSSSSSSSSGGGGGAEDAASSPATGGAPSRKRAASTSPLDALEEKVLDAVREAVSRRDAFWDVQLRPVLEGEDSSQVKLARFPQFIDAILTRFNGLMGDPAPLLLRARALFRHVLEVELPCDVRYDLSANPPRVTSANTEGAGSSVARLANGLVHIVAQDVGVAVQKLLLSMGDVADSVGNWREACASKRTGLLLRNELLRKARGRILRTVGVNGPDDVTALGDAIRRQQQQDSVTFDSSAAPSGESVNVAAPSGSSSSSRVEPPPSSSSSSSSSSEAPPPPPPSAPSSELLAGSSAAMNHPMSTEELRRILAEREELDEERRRLNEDKERHLAEKLTLADERKRLLLSNNNNSGSSGGEGEVNGGAQQQGANDSSAGEELKDDSSSPVPPDSSNPVAVKGGDGGAVAATSGVGGDGGDAKEGEEGSDGGSEEHDEEMEELVERNLGEMVQDITEALAVDEANIAEAMSEVMTQLGMSNTGTVKEKVLRAAEVLGIPTTMTVDEEAITGFGQTNDDGIDLNGTVPNLTTNGSGPSSPFRRGAAAAGGRGVEESKLSGSSGSSSSSSSKPEKPLRRPRHERGSSGASGRGSSSSPSRSPSPSRGSAQRRQEQEGRRLEASFADALGEEPLDYRGVVGMVGRSTKALPMSAARMLTTLNTVLREGGVESQEAIELRTRLCAEGLVSQLVAVLREHRADSTVQVQAFRAVAMVAYKDESRKEELLHAGFAERLMESLRQHVSHSGVQQQGLVLAVNWGGGNKQRIARLMELGFGECVVSALDTHAAQPGVQQQGLVVAANLSSGSEQRKNRLMDLGIGQALVSALKDHLDHAGVQERGLGVAYNLSNNSEERCEAFVNLGLVQLAVTAMNNHRAHRGVQEEGCSALYVLMQSVPDLASQLMDECGGLKAVKEAKETHASDKKGVVKWATKAIEEIEAHRAVRGKKK